LNTDWNRDSSDEATGVQTALSETNSGDVHDAAQQLEASLSRFVQDDQKTDENLSRLMDHPSDQIRSLEKKIEDVRRATERNLELIRNYRR